MSKWLSILILSFLLTSCLEFDDVKFKGIQNVKLPKFENNALVLDLTLKIENPNRYKIKIKPSELDVYIGGKKMGTVALDEKLVLKKRTEDTYSTQLQCKLEDGILLSLLKFATVKELSVGFKGKVKGSVLGFNKKVDIDEELSIDGSILMNLLKK
jgi:LEA14-like dessication related protein